mgnify:CR=1 FL=1
MVAFPDRPDFELAGTLPVGVLREDTPSFSIRLTLDQARVFMEGARWFQHMHQRLLFLAASPSDQMTYNHSIPLHSAEALFATIDSALGRAIWSR